MRLRRPRCRCPAGAEAEAAAEAAAAAAVVWARTQHFSRCPARRGRGAGSVNSSPSSQSLSVQIRTPLLSLPLLLPLPTPPAQLDHGCPAEPNFCRAVRPVAAPLSPEIQTNVRCPMGPRSGRGSEKRAGCQRQKWAVGGLTSQLLPPGSGAPAAPEDATVRAKVLSSSRSS